MRYLLFTVGTLGDLHPYLALGSALKLAGNDVTLMTNAEYQPQVEAAGLDFIAVQYDVSGRYVNHPDFFAPSQTWRLALRHCYLGPMRQTYEAVASLAAQERVGVVSAAWGFGARIAHEALGVPLVTLHLEPHNIRSGYKTAKMHPLVTSDLAPRWFKRLQFYIADRFFIDPEIATAVNAFRQELGLPPVRQLLDRWWNSPQKVVGLYPDWFSPPQPDWPSQLELAGFPHAETSAPQHEDETAAIEFASLNQPLVFTTGSNQQDSKEHFATAIAVCEKLDRCGLLLTPQTLPVPSGISQRIRQFRYVPLNRILPHASALVHHGGAGTTAAALHAGVPQLITPGVHGAADIADRVKRLGVAAVVAAGRFKPAAVSRELSRLLNDSHVKRQCETYRREIQQQNGIERCAEIVQSTCDTNTSAAERRPK